MDIDKQMMLFDTDELELSSRRIIFDKEKLLSFLATASNENDFFLLRRKIMNLKEIINSHRNDKEGLLNINNNGDTISINYNIFVSELQQIINAQTFNRAKYYLKRLKRGIQDIKTNKINDINLLRWKEYNEIITDSLWILNKRDTSGAHIGWYWGNFVPQIPHQMMLRYTKKNDWVLDTFAGSGTTLIECRRLGRNGIGIELNPDIVLKAQKFINMEYNKYKVHTEIITGDSQTINIGEILNNYGIKQVQLVIMHPPYHDIIKFSDDVRDLSNARDINNFLEMLGKVVDNITPYLEKGRYLVLVIGDKYSQGEWIPLGFYCMQEVLKRDYMLKSIIVKNFEETRAKRNQKELWRYRALVGGFYIFKHEYIMLFKR